MTLLGPVSIKPITTTTMTNFESKHSSYREEWLLNPIIALFLCRGRDICRVMETRPKRDDIKFSIDWFHNWIEAIKMKLPIQCLLRSTFASLNLIRLYNLKLPVFKFLAERTNHSENEQIYHPKFVWYAETSSSEDTTPMSHHLTAFKLINQLLYINFPSLERKILQKDLKSTLPSSFALWFRNLGNFF